MLKKIPQESVPQNGAKRGIEFNPQKKQQNVTNKQLPGFYGQIFQYVKKIETFGLREMNDLIHNMRHFIVNLEHRRIKLIRKKNKKNRRG